MYHFHIYIYFYRFAFVFYCAVAQVYCRSTIIWWNRRVPISLVWQRHHEVDEHIRSMVSCNPVPRYATQTDCKPYLKQQNSHCRSSKLFRRPSYFMRLQNLALFAVLLAATANAVPHSKRATCQTDDGEHEQ
jgi:hypothetical protein